MASHDIRRTLRTSLHAFGVAGGIAAAVMAYAVSQAGYWLEAAARSPARADAIVVLGGDDGDRSIRALQLYRDGYAPIIVLTGFDRGTGAPPASLSWRAEYLAARGVPRSAIRFELTARNSYEEPHGIRALMSAESWGSVIVISDPPHMRRVSWSWDRAFKGSGLTYIPVPSEADWWSPGEWWRSEQAGAFVIMEYIKLAYYIAKH
jgi:uncharacterized SAM-binding protein YcdF (DUF218 family)